MTKFADFRNQIPFLKEVVYLDSAAVCPLSRNVIDVMNNYYKKYPLNYGVGKANLASNVESMVNDVRELIASTINADSGAEVAFTKNTSEAINLVANGLKWNSGDEVVTSVVDHQSNIMPWMRLSERGVKLTIIPVDKQGFIDPADIKAALTKRTRVVTVTHGSNVTGAVQPVVDIGKVVKENSDSIYMVDTAQTAGKMPIDVKAIGCDFAAFCGRKSLMGPQGTGYLWGKLDLLRSIEPMSVGSRAAMIVDETKYEYLDVPFKLEAGVLNTGGVLGLGAAIAGLNKMGLDKVQEKIQDLTVTLFDVLSEVGAEVYSATQPGHQCGVIAWNLPGKDCNEVAAYLYDKANIIALSGEVGSRLMVRRTLGQTGVVRTSLHCFNNEDDIRTLGNALKELVNK